MADQSWFPIRVLVSLIVGLALIFTFIAGWGASYILPPIGPAATSQRASTVVTSVFEVFTPTIAPLIVVTPDLKRPTPNQEEIATAEARAATVAAYQAHLPPVPTPTIPSTLSLITPGPSFRLDIWLSTLVVQLGLLTIAGLTLRKRLTKR